MAAMILTPRQSALPAFRSLQSLPNSSLSWWRFRKSRAWSSSRSIEFKPEPADMSPYMFG